MIGVDPGPFTLRELDMMADGRSQALWGHTSNVLAMLANVNRPKNVRPFKATQFNPHSQKQRKRRKPSVESFARAILAVDRNKRRERGRLGSLRAE